jgi:tetratricopeptide (TPR) repeat protein
MFSTGLVPSYLLSSTGSPLLYISIGMRFIALCKLKYHEKAIGALDQAISLKPDDYKSWYSIGVSLDSLGRPKEAIKAYDKATKIKLSNNSTEKSGD